MHNILQFAQSLKVVPVIGGLIAPNEAYFYYWPGKAASRLAVSSEIDPLDYAILFLAALQRRTTRQQSGWAGSFPAWEKLTVEEAEQILA